MQAKIFLHNRSTSPTVRKTDAESREAAPEAAAAAGTAGRRSYGVLAALRGLIGGRREAAPATALPPSFKTLSWPVNNLDYVPLEHAHARLDCGHVDSAEMPFLLCKRLEENWRGRPILFCYEKTAAALGRDLAGKNKYDSALQVLANCKNESQHLQQAFNDFSSNVWQLVTNLPGGSHPPTIAPEVPLARIIDTIWPTMQFKNAAERQAWTERTLRSPEAFIAQSYDALSLALGRVAIVIPQAKEDMYQTGRSGSAEERHNNFRVMADAQNAYVNARDAFETTHFPISSSVLKGHSIMAHYSIPRQYWPV